MFWLAALLSALGSAAGAAAGTAGAAGTAAGAASTAGTAAGLGSTAALPAVLSGAEMGAGAGSLLGGSSSGMTALFGKLASGIGNAITTKDAIDLMRLSQQSRSSSMPALPPLPGAGSARGGTQPSLQQFLQLLAQRRGGPPALRLGR